MKMVLSEKQLKSVLMQTTIEITGAKRKRFYNEMVMQNGNSY
jgi:hypothetical protein